ncbi:MAG: hypothetical protein UT78_C0015G0010 [Candidatus Nomurabacteria bacterium GW2011_GWF2_40_12]|uniref:Mannosyl-glycoprotein endo-beta-N-acetylglucosamidase-like domain-containing protein n=2 Tax=Candidatus Nomuraibacteriota TaxID=1752729 RepID=A0A0G0TWX5_9BACT|nr:MAG: hypothetical protein UT78_C0015G0010 [Candidatus Nomurabacteria bacterium GW2011_GWF2_40_12]
MADKTVPYRSNMKNNNLIRFVQSLVFIPALTMSFTMPGVNNLETSQNILVKKVNIEAKGLVTFNKATDPEAGSNPQVLKARAEAIDAYFAERGMPLKGMGEKMVEEAIKNDLDWRLLPAIAVRESTGGKHECKRVPNNAFGWGSCKISFKSNEQAIETVARNLGGNNPNTARHYDEKTVIEILRAYNPPSIVPKYAEQVMAIMDVIGDENLTASLAVAD